MLWVSQFGLPYADRTTKVVCVEFVNSPLSGAAKDIVTNRKSWAKRDNAKSLPAGRQCEGLCPQPNVKTRVTIGRDAMRNWEYGSIPPDADLHCRNPHCAAPFAPLSRGESTNSYLREEEKRS